MIEVPSRRDEPRSNIPYCRGAALALLASVSLGGCTDRDSSVEQTTASARPTGKELYIDHCASCHGIDGSGNGPLAAQLRDPPINLRMLKQNNDGRFPTVQIQRSIDGRGMPRAHGLPDMPVWGRQWLRQGQSEAEVQARSIQLASYIATLQD